MRSVENGTQFQEGLRQVGWASRFTQQSKQLNKPEAMMERLVSGEDGIGQEVAQETKCRRGFPGWRLSGYK